MYGKVVRESDFDCSTFQVARLPHRMGYLIVFNARWGGIHVAEKATFNSQQMRLLGMTQAKQMLVDSLLARLNGVGGRK